MGEGFVVRASEGTVSEGAGWVFKVTGSESDGKFDFMVGEVDYLSGPPLHVHNEQYDSFYVLEGVLAVQVEDEVLDLHPGDFAAVPPGVPHTFDNLRLEQPSVKAINLMAPGGFQEFFDERAGLGATPEPAALDKVAEKHGVTTVGPPLRTKLGLG
jgi:quercetin dioxygenase-like cupin family protein